RAQGSSHPGRSGQGWRSAWGFLLLGGFLRSSQQLYKQLSSRQLPSGAGGYHQVVAGRPDDRRIDAWRALIATHAALVDRLSEELEDERDLPLAWYEVLLFLNRAPEGRLRMGELAG